MGMPPPGKKAMMASVRQPAPALSREQMTLMRQLKEGQSARDVLEVLRRSSCTPHAGNYAYALQRVSQFTLRGEHVSGAELKGLNDVIAARLHELRPRDLGNLVNAWERLCLSPGPAVLRDLDALLSELLDWGRDGLLVHGSGDKMDRAHVYSTCLLNGYARLVQIYGHRPSVEMVRALDGTAAVMLGLAPDGPTRSRSKVLVSGAGSTSAEELASALLLQLQCGPAMEPPVRLGAGTWSVRLPNEGAVRRALAARVVVLGESQAQLSAASPEGRDMLATMASDDPGSIAGVSQRMLVACLRWFGCTNNVARSHQSPGGPAHGHHHEQQQLLLLLPPDEGLLRCLEARLHEQLTADLLGVNDLDFVFAALAGLRSGGLPLEAGAVALARAGLLLDPDARLLADVDRRIEAELQAERMTNLGIARVLAGYVALGRLVPGNVMQLADARLQQCKPFNGAKFVVNARHREDEVDSAALLLDTFARMGHKPPGSVVSRCVDVLAYYVEQLDNDRLVAALWALARLSYGPTEAALRRFDAALLDRARRLTAPQVASAMWALAADGLMLTQPTIAELLAALDDAAPRLAVDDLANSLWALAFIGCRNKTLLDRLCAAVKAQLPHFKPHHVGIVFFALGVVAYYPGKELMEPLNDIAMAWHRNMHAIDFLHTLWGWARLQYRPPPAHLAVLQETLNPLVEAKRFTPEQLTLCCAACKYLGLLILDAPVLRP
jgi:hypothetical protein